jgi:hypothetical protein
MAFQTYERVKLEHVIPDPAFQVDPDTDPVLDPGFL